MMRLSCPSVIRFGSELCPISPSVAEDWGGPVTPIMAPARAANGLSGVTDQIVGYFVEYQVGTVPLPAALPLMLTGLAGFGFLGWRRKRMMGRISAD